MNIRALAAIFLTFASMSHAWAERPEQSEPQVSRWRPGVQGGLDVTTYSSSPSVDSGSRVGFIAGLLLECKIDPVWYIQPEFRVVQKGFTYDLQTSNSTTNFDARIAYLEIPLLVKAKFLPDALIQPFFFGGPNLGFKIGDNVDVTSGGNPVTGPPLQVDFKTVDFAIDAGLGGEYHFARRMAGFFEFRASIGLVNVSDLAGTNWKSRSYQAVFGGLFDF